MDHELLENESLHLTAEVEGIFFVPPFQDVIEELDQYQPPKAITGPKKELFPRWWDENITPISDWDLITYGYKDSFDPLWINGQLNLTIHGEWSGTHYTWQRPDPETQTIKYVERTARINGRLIYYSSMRDILIHPETIQDDFQDKLEEARTLGLNQFLFRQSNPL